MKYKTLMLKYKTAYQLNSILISMVSQSSLLASRWEWLLIDIWWTDLWIVSLSEDYSSITESGPGRINGIFLSILVKAVLFI